VPNTMLCLPNGNVLGCMENNKWMEWPCGFGQTCSNGFCSDGGNNGGETCITFGDAWEACQMAECCEGALCTSDGSWCASDSVILYCDTMGAIMAKGYCPNSVCSNGACTL
jgi:hypothetical protein